MKKHAAILVFLVAFIFASSLYLAYELGTQNPRSSHTYQFSEYGDGCRLGFNGEEVNWYWEATSGLITQGRDPQILISRRDRGELTIQFSDGEVIKFVVEGDCSMYKN